MCYVGYHFFAIWLAELKISDKFCAHLQDAKKSKNECITNKISETLKFSNLKNLDFFGKYIVGEHWNFVYLLRGQQYDACSCGTLREAKFQCSPTIHFPGKSKNFRFENFKVSEILFVVHSFFDFLASCRCAQNLSEIFTSASQMSKKC